MRGGAQLNPWKQLCSDLDAEIQHSTEENAQGPCDSCPRDVHSALLKAREENETPDEEDLFSTEEMMHLLGELPCEQAATLLNNHGHRDAHGESMISLIHAIAVRVAQHQGGMPLCQSFRKF